MFLLGFHAKQKVKPSLFAYGIDLQTQDPKGGESRFARRMTTCSVRGVAAEPHIRADTIMLVIIV